ncbi:DNA2 helicase-like [Tropilaelaps mercedesae]|uniref:DNA2 helicase-like n=1 Tax=Tropilaelaps mercedesae TaxID=418985 RepID=A0A1V9XWJ2_9ACAR|nr:DNA2 helicase-like [Tropilaelaps mercedesae]
MLAKRFLLVGDPEQLPPVILSKDARRLGLEECLFKRILRKDGSNLVVLNQQYRMNSEIMALCNQLVYEGQLQCGNHEVAQQTLRVKGNVSNQADSSTVADLKNGSLSSWEQRCVSTKLLDSVVFVDASGASEQEGNGGVGGLSNPGESNLASLYLQLVL